MDYLPPAKAIPNAFLASAKSWWAVGEKQATISEARLLRRLPFYSPSNTPSPSQPVVATSTRVELDAPKHYINTVSITPTAPTSGAVSPTPTVLLHGYGAGLAFYFRNLSALATWAGKKGASVYAIDWLGMGLSARVPFSIRARRDDISGRVHEAESFFVDTSSMLFDTQIGELTDEGAGAPVSNGDHKSIESPSKKRVEEIRDHQRDNQRQQSRARRLFMYLWEEGWSPFQVVRATTLWGPMLVGKYSARRFAGLSEEETRDMHDYILNITLAKASSEYCISHLLQPGAHAHMPLVDRIGELKIPITFIYGDNDWMDPEGGVQSVEKLRQAGNGQGKMYLVGNAGHHVYLDNHVATNELIIKELEREYEKVAAARS
ncbi:hypothetical protein Agabi119p4_4740 [Agaricus bisporus var. burnettii]|uniref:AB hydrolase-1 domain-containing protein n=1 Tax=Agaricus bisporus var. burnettii TaxID=192524 RepID=A0A8H7F3U0_AGABI|nr:hypothetical protein Agabi119p4_4740 [Agaricus bisporus var. burnettii]